MADNAIPFLWFSRIFPFPWELESCCKCIRGRNSCAKAKSHDGIGKAGRGKSIAECLAVRDYCFVFFMEWGGVRKFCRRFENLLAFFYRILKSFEPQLLPQASPKPRSNVDLKAQKCFEASKAQTRRALKAQKICNLVNYNKRNHQTTPKNLFERKGACKSHRSKTFLSAKLEQLSCFMKS